jgi:hypothetical protein
VERKLQENKGHTGDLDREADLMLLHHYPS